MAQPGATQISSATQQPAANASAHSVLPPTATGISTLGIPAAIARRPFVKRRPYQPKPKPGEAKRPNQPFAPRDTTPRPHQNFPNARQDRPTAPAPPSQFSRPPLSSFQNSRPGYPARPDFKSRPAAAGGRPSKPPFAKSHAPKSGDAKSHGPWKPRPSFRREGHSSSKPNHGGKPFQKFRSDSFPRPGQDSDYDRPIKPKSEAPWRRTESSQSTGRPQRRPRRELPRRPRQPQARCPLEIAQTLRTRRIRPRQKQIHQASRTPLRTEATLRRTKTRRPRPPQTKAGKFHGTQGKALRLPSE